MNAQPTPSSKVTLEEIAQRKEELLREIRLQQQQMTTTARRIFAPITAINSGTHAFTKTFNIGLALFDGTMLGLKIIRKIRRLFKR